MNLIDLKDDQLADALCLKLEPSLPELTARQARSRTTGFHWVSSWDFPSPAGWWNAEIGTDHATTRNNEDSDDLLVEWRPAIDLTAGIENVWRVIDEMKSRGWLFHILMMIDGWVVNAKRYEMPGFKMLTADLVQEVGDSVEEAICRAALAALSK